MRKITVLVAPPGGGKTTLAKKLEYLQGYTRISQDDSGKAGHLSLFIEAIDTGKDIVVDRLNFSKLQRSKYLEHAKLAGYETEIIVLHEPRQVCLDRMRLRQDHPTIKDEDSALRALNMFFSKYEKPLEGEADTIRFVYPEGFKPECCIIDLDGTLCNLNKRLHHVRPEPGQKKNWTAFFEELSNDDPHEWCARIVKDIAKGIRIVYASGRPDIYKEQTEEWFKKHGLDLHHDRLYMRCRGDHRDDTVAKEIILDFEILTRFSPLFFIDDRARVVNLWRSRGFVALQCHEGNF